MCIVFSQAASTTPATRPFESSFLTALTLLGSLASARVFLK
jgi:hypothetical protein